MPHRLLHIDNVFIAMISTSFFSNLISTLSDVDLSPLLTAGSFILALTVGIVKLKTFRIDLKIKRLQLKREQEKDGKSN